MKYGRIGWLPWSPEKKPDAPVIAVGVSSHIDESLGLIHETCAQIDTRNKDEVAIRSSRTLKLERRKTDEF